MLPGTGGTTRFYTVPASAAPGDLLLVWAYIEATGITFSLTGWTKVAESTQASEGWVAVCFALPNWDGKTTTYTLTLGRREQTQLRRDRGDRRRRSENADQRAKRRRLQRKRLLQKRRSHGAHHDG